MVNSYMIFVDICFDFTLHYCTCLLYTYTHFFIRNVGQVPVLKVS